jgi:hypothetical protein
VANVYSHRFGSAAGVSGGPYTAFVCPPGNVAVVKCLTIVWGNVTVSGLDVWWQLDDGTKLTRVMLGAGLSPVLGGRDLWFGDCVLATGESLLYQAGTGTADFHASGYLLTAP